jgi:hypothetical protein
MRSAQSELVALYTCHVTTRLSVAPRNEHVAPSHQTVHGCAQLLGLAFVRVRCWCILGRISLASRSYVKAEVI